MEKENGNDDLILLGIAILIGYVDDYNKPKKYHYEDTIVMVNKKYQCPNHCKVDHPHNVYFSSETGGIIIDEDKLGKRIKEKKKK
tara:strand:+ start:180 stop:434 length:255 start_codon:yes stop_codon:yes gene_type:complete